MPRGAASGPQTRGAVPTAAPRLTALWALLLLLRARPSSAQHAVYRFAERRGGAESLSSCLRWERAERGDVYLATKFFTGCGVGRFGGQIHSDGTQLAILSMWDGDGAAGSAQGASPWCTRFSQGAGPWPHGQGAHCIVPFRFEMGSEYCFELTRASNGSSAFWSLSVSDGGPGPAEFVGSILVRPEGTGRDCSLLEPEAESSHEHYAGGAFYSAAAWRGPFLGGEGGAAPVDVDVDCGPGTESAAAAAVEANASSAPHGGPGGGATIRFRRGPGVPQDCERPSLWQQAGLGGRGVEAAAGPAARFGPGPAGSSAMLWAGGIAALLGAGAIATSACLRRGRDGAPCLPMWVQVVPKDFCAENNAPAGPQLALLDGGRPSDAGEGDDGASSEHSVAVRAS